MHRDFGLIQVGLVQKTITIITGERLPVGGALHLFYLAAESLNALDVQT
jgi:hypothetical protein